MDHNITIISDLHLGSNVCRSENIINFLQQINTKTLILNGDIFDNLDFRRLKKSHWRIIKKLRVVAKKTKLIWIAGNHDRHAEPIAHLIGASFAKDYIYQSANKIIYITHGDQFDALISSRPLLTRLADNIYRLIQRFDTSLNNDYYYSGKIKLKSKTLSKCLQDVKDKAILHRTKHNYDAIIIGHLHKAEHMMSGNGKEYVNCGCWTDKQCHYVTIDDERISLNKY